MEEFREFEEKTLDEAIRAACKFFDATRERLEIELVQDAKNGIFGLVGARKALIRARLTQMQSSVDLLRQKKSQGLSSKKVKKQNKKTNRHEIDQVEYTKEVSSQHSSSPYNYSLKGDNGIASKEKILQVNNRACGENFKEYNQVSALSIENKDRFSHKFVEVGSGEDLFDSNSNVLIKLFSELDQDKLISEAQNVATKLITPILGDVPIDVHISNSQLEIHVDCGEYSGLMIGRGGQTLASLQYLSSRILSRIMSSSIRVQFNIGDYCEQQYERLRSLALSLAERVKNSGRSCSTRPMSSYHRRIIHLTLQNIPDIQTRSSGDGALKRIIIQRRRQERH